MPQITLGTYTLRVREKRQSEGEEEWESLGSIGLLQPSNFLDFVDEFFADLHQEHEEDQRRQSLFVVEEYEIHDQTISGFVSAGPWGASAEIVDHQTRDITHEMSPEEAPLIPFFFLLHVPPDTERGIMMLQRHGRRGVKTHLCTALKRSFSGWKKGFMLEFWRHVPGQVLQFLTEGKLRKVEVISYDVPTDYADVDELLRDNTQEWEEIRGEIRTQIVAKRGERFPIPGLFRDVVTGEATFHEVREQLGVGNGRIRITIDYHGNERTIDLADPTDIAPLIDITDEVSLEEGHPNREELRAFAMDFLPDLIEDVQARYQ